MIWASYGGLTNASQRAADALRYRMFLQEDSQMGIYLKLGKNGELQAVLKDDRKPWSAQDTAVVDTGSSDPSCVLSSIF